MTNQPPQNQPSLPSTTIFNSSGGEIGTISQDTAFNAFGTEINGVATLDITFNNPVQLGTIQINNYLPTLGSNSTYLTIYQPLDTQVLALPHAETFALTTIDPSMPISRLVISAGLNAPEFEVIFEAIFIYNAPNTEQITGSGTTANAGVGDRFILDGLRNNVEEITTRLDNVDRFIQDGLTTNLQALTDANNNFGDAVLGAVADINQNNTDATNNFADKLQTNFTEGITNLVNAVLQSNPFTAGLSPDIVANIIGAIKALVDEIILEIGSGIKGELGLGDATIGAITNNLLTPLGQAITNQGDTINQLLQGRFSNLDDFYRTLKQNGANSEILSGLQNVFTVVFLIASYLKARTGTAEIVLQQLMLSKDTPNINDINTNISAYIRGFKNIEQLQTDLAKYGLNKDRVNELLSTRALLLGLSDIKTALQRGLISETEHDTLLAQTGLAPGNVELLKSVYPLLPSPTDITRMADKHIFAPDIPQIFGQNSELDEGYSQSMQLWGISEDWTKKLWASHWSLPGLQETFDLWHRGLISDDELNVYFKLTDILPFFREKLKLLSHNLIGRVDIRRFYHVGVFTQQDVYNAFIKLGFSIEDAQKQTQFTVENDRLSELPKHVKIRTLTESMVVKAFKEGIITQPDAVNRLAQVGYLPQDATLILQLETQTAALNKVSNKTQYYHDKTVNLVLSDYAKGVFGRTDARNYLITIGVPSGEADQELYYADLERITQLKSLVINHVRTAYTKGQIDKAQATNLMLSFGFGMSEIELLFEELDIIKELRNKELTLAQLTSLVKKSIISQEQFATELANMGYNATHVNWLVLETFGGP